MSDQPLNDLNSQSIIHLTREFNDKANESTSKERLKEKEQKD
jgi:hypothetical protein